MDAFQDLLNLAKAANGVTVISHGWVALAQGQYAIVASEDAIIGTIVYYRGNVFAEPPDYLFYFDHGKLVTSNNFPPMLKATMWVEMVKAVMRETTFLRGE